MCENVWYRWNLKQKCSTCLTCTVYITFGTIIQIFISVSFSSLLYQPFCVPLRPPLNSCQNYNKLSCNHRFQFSRAVTNWNPINLTHGKLKPAMEFRPLKMDTWKTLAFPDPKPKLYKDTTNMLDQTTFQSRLHTPLMRMVSVQVYVFDIVL